MSRGFICDWNFNDGFGRISSCSGTHGVFPFDFEHCSSALQTNLSQHRIIHANGPCPGPAFAIQVTFDLDLTGNAINVR